MTKFMKKKYRDIGYGEGDYEACMEHESCCETISELNSKAMVMDGFDDCIAGTVELFGRSPIVCYDKAKVIDKLMKDGMTDFEALEYFEFNQLGAYIGEGTPCFITTEYKL